MSVQSEINRISSKVSESYTAVSNKGGTLPVDRTIANLSTAISSIPSGGSYSGTPTPGETCVIGNSALGNATKTRNTYVASGLSITIPFTGTYRIKWCYTRYVAAGTWGTAIGKNGTVIDASMITSGWNNTLIHCSYDLECLAGDVIEPYGMSPNNSYAGYATFIGAYIDWANGFE